MSTKKLTPQEKKERWERKRKTLPQAKKEEIKLKTQISTNDFNLISGSSTFSYIPRFWKYYDETYIPGDNPQIKISNSKILINKKFYSFLSQDNKYNQYVAKIGHHNLYIYLQNYLMLKQSLLNRFPIDLVYGLDPYIVNEITVVQYLQSSPNYYKEKWFNRFTELQIVSVCDSLIEVRNLSNTSLCLIYKRYVQTLQNWRDNIGQKPIPFLNVAHFIVLLLESLEILEKYQIQHRGITITNCFITPDLNVVLGGWSNASFFFNDGRFDNLVYTSILKDTAKEPELFLIDRLMVCNVIYYMIYGVYPSHVLEATEKIKKMENIYKEETQKNPSTAEIEIKKQISTQIETLISSSSAWGTRGSSKYKDKFDPPSHELTYFSTIENIILQLITDLLQVTYGSHPPFFPFVEKSIVEICNNFKKIIMKTEEYHFYSNAIKTKQIILPELIQNILNTFHEISLPTSGIQIENVKKKECIQIFGQNLEDQSFIQSKLHEQIIPSKFLFLYRIFKTEFAFTDSKMVCVVTSLYYRTLLQMLKTRFNLTEYVLLLSSKTTMSELSIRVSLFLIYQCTLFYIVLKIYGNLYLPSHFQKFKECLIPIFELKNITDNDNQKEAVNEILMIIYNYELAISKIVDFKFITTISQYYFELPKQCPPNFGESTQIIPDLIKFIKEHYAYVTFDMFLFLEDKGYTQDEIKEEASNWGTTQKNILEFIVKLEEAKIPIYFISFQDGINTFLPNLQVEKNSEILSLRDSKTIYSVWDLFYSSQNKREAVSLKMLDSIIPETSKLFGNYIYKHFIENLAIAEPKTTEWKNKVVSLNLKPYMMLASPARTGYLDLIRADTLNLYYFIHNPDGPQEETTDIDGTNPREADTSNFSYTTVSEDPIKVEGKGLTNLDFILANQLVFETNFTKFYGGFTSSENLQPGPDRFFEFLEDIKVNLFLSDKPWVILLPLLDQYAQKEIQKESKKKQQIHIQQRNQVYFL